MKKGLIWILLTALLFTTMEPVSKLIAEQVNPFAITCIRFLIGGAILLPFSIAKLRKTGVKLSGKEWLCLAALGVLCICVSMPLLQYAVMMADSPAVIAIIFSSNSVFTIGLSTLILKEKITPPKAVAILLCGAGVLVSTDFATGNGFLSVGLTVVSALLFSLYTVLSKKFMKKISGIVQTGFSFFGGSFVLLAALMVGGVEVTGAVSGGNIWHLVYLGIAVTGLGYWCYFKALEEASAMAASFVFFIKPILTPFAAFAVNGIVPGGQVFIALALVLAGSYLSTQSRLPFVKAKES